MEAVLRKIDPENMYFGHVLLLLQRAVALVRHLAIPSKGGIHPISLVLTRVGSEPVTMFFIEAPLGHDYEFRSNGVFHLLQPDVVQEIYGVPEGLSALLSDLLNENATLFRRRYYLNGAHAGFIFYLSEPLADGETSEEIEKQLGQAKGVGTFKHMFV
ncbi:hypothetical protein [Blastomonas fulva]|jgi:hypothetical protein|uniref:hypothetical protein n=1 Tax=Blastomonas fulva TaxID=1550728 RepID=UPI003D29F7EF